MRPGVHAERPSPVTRRDFMSFIEVSPQVSSRSLAFKKDHVDLETHVAFACSKTWATMTWTPSWNCKSFSTSKHNNFPLIYGKHETRGSVDL